MLPQEIQEFVRNNAILSGPTLDMTGTFWRYSATLKGHQALSDFHTDKNAAREQAIEVLLEALETHGVTFPELAPPAEPVPTEDAPIFEFEGHLPGVENLPPDEPDATT